MDAAPRGSRMMTTEWSFPRLNFATTTTPKRDGRWIRWSIIILGILSIISLVPTIFCLVLLAMGSLTLLMELFSLICAAVVLVVGVLLLGLWTTVSQLTQRWRRIAFIACGAVVAVNALFGLATWVLMIVMRKDIRDPLDSVSGVALGRERIIAIGFACWVLILMTQIAFIISLAINFHGQMSTPEIRSSTAFSALSPSSSVIPMRRATIHHHPSITSLTTASSFTQTHRPAQSLTIPPSPSFPALNSQPSNNSMPITTLSSPMLKRSLSNFPLPPTTIPPRSTDSIRSLQVSQVDPSPFPFPPNPASTSSLPIYPPPATATSPSKSIKRNSKILKSLAITPTILPSPRKKPSLSSLTTLSPRKRFKSHDGSISVQGSISSLQHSDITVWDDWDEDPKVKERVEMSFESVRLEKDLVAPRGPIGLGVGVGVVAAGTAEGGNMGSPFVLGTPGSRSVSGGSTPGECGWVSPASVLKGGFKWS